MARNFHERFEAEAPPMPSPRSTGLVFAAVSALIAALYHADIAVAGLALAALAIFAGLAVFAPAVLGPLNFAWFKLALLLHRIVSPIVMFVLFALVIVPAGLLMQRRYDPLLRRKPVGATTYWIERPRPPVRADMRNQF